MIFINVFTQLIQFFSHKGVNQSIHDIKKYEETNLKVVFFVKNSFLNSLYCLF